MTTRSVNLKCNAGLICLPTLLALFLALSGMLQAEPAPFRRTLTSVKDVRDLSVNEAKQALAVHLRGVVTARSGWKNSFFFQDQTSGISVDPTSTIPDVWTGEEVEILGTTNAGLFEPNVTATAILPIGKGKMPPSRVFRYDQLQAGQEDSQWIELVGIARSASVMELWGRRVLRLVIETGTGKVETRVQEFAGVDPEKLLDATVRIRGVCGTNFNDKRQLIGVRMFVSSMSDIRVLRAPPADPFSQPLISIGSVQRFGSAGELAHRVRVRATVTYQTLGRGLYIQDQDGGLRVNTTQNLLIHPGQLIDAVGFTSINEQSPALEDSQIRLIGPGQMPAVPSVAPEDVIKLKPDGFWSTPYESTLISVLGHLVDSNLGPEGTTLVVHERGILFRARLRGGKQASGAATQIENGSLVRMTGVCTVFRDESGDPISFLIKLRSPQDVAIIAKPNWFSEKRLLWMAGLLLAVALAMGVRYYLQRKRVEKELAASRHRFQLFLDNSPAIAYIKDAAGRIVWGNAAWKQIGFTRDTDWSGKTDSDLWPTEVAQTLRDNDRTVLEQGRAMEFLESVPLASGETKHFLSTKFPFELEGGEPMLGGTSVDVTERVRVEQLLKRSEVQYRELFEKNPMPAWVYRLNTLAIVDVNTAAIEHYGYSREEFLCLTLREIRMPEDVDAIEQSFVSDGAKAEPRGWRHRRKDGSVIHVQLMSHAMELDAERCRLVMVNDITERLENEEKFRVLFEESSDAHLLFDDQTLRDCNQAAVTMLKAVSKAQAIQLLSDGVSHQEQIGGHGYSHVRSEHLLAMQDQGSTRFDCVKRCADGCELEIEVSLTKVTVASRPMVLEVWHDLTKRKEMEQRLAKEAMTDPLTGLANRRQFNLRLEAALKLAKIGGSQLSLCVGDLDHFKGINDKYGHNEGDQVLITIGQLLRDGVRQTDCVARIGGDEFCMFFPGTAAPDVETLLSRVQGRLSSVCFGLTSNVPFSVSATFGIAELLPSHKGPGDLFEAADRALYRAKEQGRNRIGTVVERLTR